MSRLEHVNITVADANATAMMLCNIFGWRIRWQGESADGASDVIHVGEDDSYLSLFARKGDADKSPIVQDMSKIGLQHIGIVVDDIDAARARVASAGYESGPEMDYDPGRRFYFFEENGLEIEVVSYA